MSLGDWFLGQKSMDTIVRILNTETNRVVEVRGPNDRGLLVQFATLMHRIYDEAPDFPLDVPPVGITWTNYYRREGE